MHRLGIEMLSVFGLSPIDHVELAATLGCECISLGLASFPYNPHGYPAFSLRDDARLRRETVAALAGDGIAVSLGEGCIIRPDVDISSSAADLDVFAELGTERINTMSFDRDLARTFDQFAILAEMVADRGMQTVIEFGPRLVVGDLATAVAAIEQVGRDDLRVLIDAMHFVRTGGTAAQLSALDPTMVAYLQLCDAPIEPTNPNYMDEAMFERMVPGTGELPLAEIVAALPGVDVGLEVPMRAEAEAGVGPADRLRPSVDAARSLLAR